MKSETERSKLWVIRWKHLNVLIVTSIILGLIAYLITLHIVLRVKFQNAFEIEFTFVKYSLVLMWLGNILYLLEILAEKLFHPLSFDFSGTTIFWTMLWFTCTLILGMPMLTVLLAMLPFG